MQDAWTPFYYIGIYIYILGNRSHARCAREFYIIFSLTYLLIFDIGLGTGRLTALLITLLIGLPVTNWGFSA